MNGDNPQDRTDPGPLTRIARTLSVPIATFLTADPVEISDAEADVAGAGHLDQVVAVLRLFVRLKSPEARARCLAYVVHEATREDLSRSAVST